MQNKNIYFQSIHELKQHQGQQLHIQQDFYIDQTINDKIARLPNNISLQFFRENFESTNQPCIIQNLNHNWINWEWKQIESNYQNTYFRVAIDGDGNYLKVPLSQYIEYIQNSNERNPLYLFEGELPQQMLNQYYIPHLFPDDILGLLGQIRPQFRWFLIGPPKSGSVCHQDPYHTSAWNTLLHGSKRWIMFPPQVDKKQQENILQKKNTTIFVKHQQIILEYFYQKSNNTQIVTQNSFNTLMILSMSQMDGGMLYQIQITQWLSLKIMFNPAVSINFGFPSTRRIHLYLKSYSMPYNHGIQTYSSVVKFLITKTISNICSTINKLKMKMMDYLILQILNDIIISFSQFPQHDHIALYHQNQLLYPSLDFGLQGTLHLKLTQDFMRKISFKVQNYYNCPNLPLFPQIRIMTPMIMEQSFGSQNYQFSLFIHPLLEVITFPFALWTQNFMMIVIMVISLTSHQPIWEFLDQIFKLAIIIQVMSTLNQIQQFLIFAQDFLF